MQCLLQTLFENRFPPAGLPKPTQLPLRRHHDLRTCIPGLERTLLKSYFKGIWTELRVLTSWGGGGSYAHGNARHTNFALYSLHYEIANDIFKLGSGNVFFGEALVQTEATGTARGWPISQNFAPGRGQRVR
jgi:hypothetical protein